MISARTQGLWQNNGGGVGTVKYNLPKMLRCPNSKEPASMGEGCKGEITGKGAWKLCDSTECVCKLTDVNGIKKIP